MLGDGLLLVQHLVLCQREALVVIVDRLKLEVEAVSRSLKLRKEQGVFALKHFSGFKSEGQNHAPWRLPDVHNA